MPCARDRMGFNLSDSNRIGRTLPPPVGDVLAATQKPFDCRIVPPMSSRRCRPHGVRLTLARWEDIASTCRGRPGRTTDAALPPDRAVNVVPLMPTTWCSSLVDLIAIWRAIVKPQPLVKYPREETMFEPATIPTLSGIRITLRAFTLSDAPIVQDHLSRPEIAPWTLNMPYPYPDGAAEAWILKQ